MKILAAACFIALTLVFQPAIGETQYLTIREALQLTFQDSEEVVPETRRLSPQQREAFKKILRYQSPRDEWKFYIARSHGKVDGYALVDHEIGKTEPITFLVALTPEGRVRTVEVLVFREPIGGEVRHHRFLEQYRGKGETDPITVGRDIKNISGATLSARAVSRGVKRAVTLWKLFYAGTPSN